MNCINCFFTTKNQNSLKHAIINKYKFCDFLSLLKEYKKVYLDSVRKLSQIEKCNSCYSIANNDYYNWTKILFKDICDNIDKADEVFETMINIYNCYINDYENGRIKFKEFIKDNLSLYTSGTLKQALLYYRGRINNNSNNWKDYFHIPFNQKGKIKSTRFGIKGEPVLYLGNLLLGCKREIQDNESDCISYFCFVPDLVKFNKLKIADLTNNLNEKIIEAKSNKFSNINYNYLSNFDLGNYSLNKQTLEKYLKKSIIYEILTFPKNVNNNLNQKDEYLLSNEFTSLLKEFGFDGILYPSSKDYQDMHELYIANNLALFTKEKENCDYDMELAKNFCCFQKVNLNKNILIDDVNEKYSKCVEILKKRGCASDALIYIKKQINYVTKITINNKKYYDTLEGKMELTCMSHLMECIIYND